MRFPPCDFQDRAALRDALAKDEPWLEPMQTIAARHGFAGAPFVRTKTGSGAIFFAGDDLVVKLYSPRGRPQIDAEGDVLARVQGRLPVATPELVARGEFEEWPYLVSSRLSGTPLVDVWARISPHDRAGVLEELGGALAALHEVSAAGLRLTPPSWPEQVEQRLAAASEEARAFVEPLRAELAAAPRVLVHADAHHEHLLLEERDGHWHLIGLFDFADARLAPREYDLVTPAAFLVKGNRDLATALLRGIGYAAAEWTRDLAKRLFAFEFLHLYADLARDLAMIGATPAPLPQLATSFWPIARGA
jgi:hygromycin-B 7''-O-kinase